MNGLITKTSGSAYAVMLSDGSIIEAHVKGNFRILGIRSTNPVAVGDRVMVQQLQDGTNWITAIEERRNYIIRRSTNLSKQSHILAANIDQAALIVTIDHPRTSTTFIDRFLATCEAYEVPAVLIFNKIKWFIRFIYIKTIRTFHPNKFNCYLSIYASLLLASSLFPQVWQLA